VDVYETDFSPVNQRNIFRQASQKRLDISLRKEIRITDRYHLRYGFNVFNLTNTTSMDIAQNGVQIGQHGSCGNALTISKTTTGGQGTSGDVGDCAAGYEKYGMIITNQSDQAGPTVGPAGGGTAGSNLYQKPFTNGTAGKATVVPTTLPLGVNGCSTATAVSSAGCANNGATFGSVTGTIGSSRVITMDLHLTF
jgi:hypothetical protein